MSTVSARAQPSAPDLPDSPALRRPLGEQVARTLQAAGRSPHTRRAYEHAIGLFLEYLGRRCAGRPLAEASTVTRPSDRGRAVHSTEWAYRGSAAVLAAVDPGDLDDYRAWREEQGDSPATASTRTYAVRTFLAVAYRDRILPDATAQRLGVKAYQPRQHRGTREVGRRLVPEEVRRLRRAIPLDSAKGRRDRAILDLMLYLGLRCAEVATLRLSDFRYNNGRWWILVRGKGQKTRHAKVHDVAYQSVASWLEVRGAGWGDDVPLFVNVNKGDALGGRPLNTSAIARLVCEYGAMAGLAPERGPGRLAPHDLRRTCARNAYDNGAPLLKVQSMLGHADPSTTAVYIGKDKDDAKTGVDFVDY